MAGLSYQLQILGIVISVDTTSSQYSVTVGLKKIPHEFEPDPERVFEHLNPVKIKERSSGYHPGERGRHKPTDRIP